MGVPIGRNSKGSKTRTLCVGDVAPDFELPGHRAKDKVRLRDFRGLKHVVLAFYPLDWTGT